MDPYSIRSIFIPKKGIPYLAVQAKGGYKGATTTIHDQKEKMRLKIDDSTEMVDLILHLDTPINEEHQSVIRDAYIYPTTHHTDD